MLKNANNITFCAEISDRICKNNIAFLLFKRSLITSRSKATNHVMSSQWNALAGKNTIITSSLGRCLQSALISRHLVLWENNFLLKAKCRRPITSLIFVKNFHFYMNASLVIKIKDPDAFIGLYYKARLQLLSVRSKNKG